MNPLSIIKELVGWVADIALAVDDALDTWGKDHEEYL